MQLPLDTFYFIVKQYKEHGLFPPGVSGNTKQSIQRLCQMVQAKDGKLYSNTGRSAGRLIITTEKARFSILRKAHARGGLESSVFISLSVPLTHLTVVAVALFREMMMLLCMTD